MIIANYMSLTLRETKSEPKLLYNEAVELSGHSGAVLGAKFSPDGMAIASAGLDRTVLLWQLPTSEGTESPNYGVLEGHKSGVSSVKWASLTKLFTTSADGTVSFWDAETGEKLRRGVGHESPVNDSAVIRDGLCVTVGDDGSIRMWDEREKRHVRKIQTPFPLVGCCASDDGRVVYVSGVDPVVQAYDLGSGMNGVEILGASEETGTMSGTSGETGRTSDNPGENSTSDPIWRCGPPLTNGTDTITGLGRSSDGSMLVLRSMNGSVHSFNGNRIVPEGISRFGQSYEGASGNSKHSISRVAFSPNDVYICSGSGDGSCILWATASGRMVAKYEGHDRNFGGVLDIDFHPTEKILLTTGMDGKVIVREY